MSSQQAGIPLYHPLASASSSSAGGFKLLELPPELVALLEGENPPVLKLEPSPSAALLRTGEKTYSLRQKNTSNALIILSSSSTSSTSSTSSIPGLETEDFGQPTAVLRAVATVHETVELVPEASGTSRSTSTGAGAGAGTGTGSAAAAAKTGGGAARGKWHERFGRTR